MKVFAKLRYVNSLTRKGNSDKAAGRKYGSVEGHLKYIGFRSTELSKDGAGFFDRENRHADWKAFYQRVKNHPALKYSKSIKVHQGILSLWGNDYKNYVQQTGKDFRDITRKVMEQLEIRKGVKLDWIAAFHEESDHPHVHFAIKAVGDTAPGVRSPRVKLDNEDLEFIKKVFYQEVEPYVLDYQYSPEHQSRDTYRATNDYDKSLFQLSMLVNTFSNEMDQLQKKTERESDYLMRKKSKKNKDRDR